MTRSPATTRSPALAARRIAATPLQASSACSSIQPHEQSGISTSPGYDNATGLGSVNITNLVNNWSTVGFTGDTVSLTGPSGSVPHGIPQTFHVSINPAGATGSVALVATPPTGTPVAIGSFSENSAITLNSGVATITTDLLPGGAGVQVVAKYGGDGTFAAGTSTPVTLTVTPETSPRKSDS